MASCNLELAVCFLRSFHLHDTARPTNFSARRVGDLGAFLVHVAGVYWLVIDNGGELMVERVNSGKPGRAVPLTWHELPLNEATVAYRIACVLRGRDIDYRERLDDDDQAALFSVLGSSS